MSFNVVAVMVESRFSFVAQYPLLVLTGFSELLILIFYYKLTNDLLKKYLKSLKLQHSFSSIIHLFILFSVNVERAYKNKNRRGFIEYTLFETALPCIVNACSFRVMLWRF